MPDSATCEPPAIAPALAAGEAQVWTVPLGNAEGAGQRRLQRCESVLSAVERTRASRYGGLRREEFVIARASLRWILARHLRTEAAAIEFSTSANGQPRLGRRGDLHFSVAHTAGLAVIAISRDLEIGVDVEQIRAVAHPLAVARDFFPESEVDELRRAGREAVARLFLLKWTRREALLKAWGASTEAWVALQKFTFPPTAEAGHQIALRDSNVAGRAQELLLDPGYVGALATRGAEFTMVGHPAVEFGSEGVTW